MTTIPDPFARAADILDPPPPRPERQSPSAFAEGCSRGRWQRAPHLDLIEDAVLDCIANSGRLILSVSVRHGKSEYASHWLPAWYLGTHPDARVILAAHEADFAGRWGRAARDELTEYGPEIFGVEVSKRSEAANRWDLARPHTGGMLTVGVGGSPIGRGADLMIIDDPVKSYADAMSPLQRQKVKEWWAGTMVSRMEPDCAVILIMARWHEDDLAGHLLSQEHSTWQELRLPAFCDEPGDPLGREIGDPLWPKRWPTEKLQERRRETMLEFGEVVWLAQYQGRPTTPKGGMFPEDRWRFMTRLELPEGLRWVRAWDLAATEDGGDWTVGARMARLPDGRFAIDDVVRGQWDSRRVRAEIARAAERDPLGTHVELPQDPGQAGKDQAQQLVASLAGRSVQAKTQSGSKEVRATGYAAQQQAGNVVLVVGEWNGVWVAEHQAFPRGTHDDQVDTGATAFNRLAGIPDGPAKGRSPAGERTARGSALARRSGGRLTA